MVVLSDSRTLERVEYIRVGNGVLDFAIEGENHEYTLWCSENADWTIETPGIVENSTEDRFLVKPPKGEHFICEITADGEERNEGPVRCWID